MISVQLFRLSFGVFVDIELTLKNGIYIAKYYLLLPEFICSVFHLDVCLQSRWQKLLTSRNVKVYFAYGFHWPALGGSFEQDVSLDMSLVFGWSRSLKIIKLEVFMCNYCSQSTHVHTYLQDIINIQTHETTHCLLNLCRQFPHQNHIAFQAI